MSKYHNAFQGFVKVFTGAKQPGVKEVQQLSLE